MKSSQLPPLLKNVFCFVAYVVLFTSLNLSFTHAAQQTSLPEDKPLEGEARQVAAQMIRQLGNPQFELRQQASRKLWKIGPPVLKLLQTAVDGGINSEARMRAKELSTLIKVGLKSDADADVVRCVVGFLDRESMYRIAPFKNCVIFNKLTSH